MEKSYKKSCKSAIYALAIIVAGACTLAQPAFGLSCFLPSGNCVTGKIDTKQDGGNETIEYCNGYDVSESEYNKKYNNTSCFSCGSPCTRTSGGTFYKCETVNNTKWYDDYNVCCTNGTKYDKDDKACCPSGGCNHPCPACRIVFVRVAWKPMAMATAAHLVRCWMKTKIVQHHAQ